MIVCVIERRERERERFDVITYIYCIYITRNLVKPDFTITSEANRTPE
jgi:hypothetical protein